MMEKGGCPVRKECLHDRDGGLVARTLNDQTTQFGSVGAQNPSGMLFGVLGS